MTGTSRPIIIRCPVCGSDGPMVHHDIRASLTYSCEKCTHQWLIDLVEEPQQAFPGVAERPPGTSCGVSDWRGGNAVAWEHVPDPLPSGRSRLLVRGPTSSHSLDLVWTTPADGHRSIFIERAYTRAVLPRPLLMAFATVRRIMEPRHLRGSQRRSTAPTRPRKLSDDTWRKALLVCGIASSLLYAAMIWGIRYEGYSPISQVPSELTAIGAPTQLLWARLGWLYTVLVTAFGFGVWKSAGGNHTVRIVSGLILAYASLGLLWPFAAMHQREVLAAGGGTLSDTLHVVLGAVTVFLMFLAIGFGASAFGKPFRLYSMATIVALLTFGALTFVEAPGIEANLPTPWIGLWERINISVFLLWVAVLCPVLWGRGGSRYVAAGEASGMRSAARRLAACEVSWSPSSRWRERERPVRDACSPGAGQGARPPVIRGSGARCRGHCRIRRRGGESTPKESSSDTDLATREAPPRFL